MLIGLPVRCRIALTSLPDGEAVGYFFDENTAAIVPPAIKVLAEFQVTSAIRIRNCRRRVQTVAARCYDVALIRTALVRSGPAGLQEGWRSVLHTPETIDRPYRGH